MQKRNKIFYVGFCFIFFLFLCGHIVVAGEPKENIPISKNSEQVDENNENTAMKMDTNVWSRFEGAAKLIVGGSLLGGISYLLGIWNFVKERDYDIASVEIELLQDTPQNIGKFTVFECVSMEKNNKQIELEDVSSHFYYRMRIKVKSPSKTNKIYNLAIREFDIEINGYKFLYKPQKTKFLNYEWCGTDPSEETCEFLIIPYKARKNSIQKHVNEITIFQQPSNCIMHIDFATNGSKRKIYCLLRPKKRTIWFEKCVYENEPTRIGIKKADMRKGRLSNEISGI